MVIFCGNLPQYFNPRNSRVEITMVIYHGIFYNICPRPPHCSFSPSPTADRLQSYPTLYVAAAYSKGL